MKRLASLVITAIVATPAPGLAQTTFSRVQPIAFDPATASELKPRYIGPVGNRTIAVAGIPGDPNVYYVGAASGGIWKTTDGGIHWASIFDSQDVSSVGSLAVAPSNASIVWAGTGESFIRSHISLGNGIYKSTDAGRTWTRMGLEATGRIGRLAIRRFITRALRRAGSGRRPTAASIGRRCPTRCQLPPSARWRWLHRIRAWCGQAPARRGRSARAT